MKKILQKLLRDKVIDRAMAWHLWNQWKMSSKRSREKLFRKSGIRSEILAPYWEDVRKADNEDLLKKKEPEKSSEFFANYKIIKKLATGGMGIVYKASSPSGRIVALKVLTHLSYGDENILRRFYREAKATEKLKHPNIIPIYHFGHHKAKPYYAMKYAEGDNFEDFLRQEAPPLRKGLKILCKILRGLHHAHRKGIIHRDIKPSNILIDKLGEPFLADFGLAKFVDHVSMLTHSEIKIGTPYYMCPEQVHNSVRAITSLSDIYSMGVILYQLLAGKLPFQANSLPELYQKIVDKYPATPERIDPKLVDICFKAMAKNPEERYSSALNMARDIESYLSGNYFQIQSPTISMRMKTWYKQRPQLKPYFFILGLFFSSMFLAFLLHFSFRKPPKNIFQQIKICHQKKEYQKALDILEKSKYSSLKYLKLKLQILQSLKKREDIRKTCMEIYAKTKKKKYLKIIAGYLYHWGYFEETSRFLKKLEKISPSLENKCLIGRCLLFQGKNKEAFSLYKEIFKKNKSFELEMDYTKILFAKGKYRKCLEILEKYKLFSSPKYTKAQAYLLKARILWQKNSKNFSKGTWLLGQKTSYEYKILEQEYSAILELLQKAKEKISASTTCFATNLLRQKINFYLELLTLEKGKKNLEIWKNFSQKKFPEFRSKIFFLEVIIRSLIRHKKWKKAEKICNPILYKYPWATGVYLLRSLVLFQLKKYNQGFSDIISIQRLNRDSFIAINNAFEIIFDHLTQQEYMQIKESICSYNETTYRTFTKLLWGKYQSVLLENFHEKDLEGQREKIKNLRFALLRHSFLKNPIYSIKIRRQGNQAISNLEKILRDEKEDPYLRMLAAQMMLHIRRAEGFTRLKKIARGNSYPLNILAIHAFRSYGISCPISRISYDTIIKKHSFYRLLLAFNFQLSDHLPILQLLEDPKPLVSLCAAYKLRKIYKDPIAAEKKIISFLKHQNPRIRAFACYALWDFENKWVQADRNQIQRHWRLYSPLFLKTLSDSHLEVRKATLHGLITKPWRFFLQDPRVQKTPVYLKIKKKLRDLYREPFLKIWTTMALGAFSERNDASIIVKNSNTNFVTRFASVGYVYFSHIEVTKFYRIFQKCLTQKTITKSDRMTMQFALFLVGETSSNYLKRFFVSFAEKTIKTLDEKNIHIKKSAISSLSWNGMRNMIPHVQNFLKHKDLDIRRASAGTLCALSIQFEKENLPGLNQYFQKKSLEIRKAAAFGYYLKLQRYLQGRIHNKIYFDRHYPSYIRAQDRNINRSTTKWLMYLENATEIYPCAKYYHEKAILYTYLKKFSQARMQVQKALESCPDSDQIFHKTKAVCLSLLGEICLHTKQYEKAKDFLEKSIQNHPFHFESHFYLGKFYYQKRQYLKSQGYFLQALLCSRNKMQKKIVLDVLDMLRKFTENK